MSGSEVGVRAGRAALAGGAEGPTKDQLYEEARKRRVHGRSSMTKQELKSAPGR